MISMWKTIACSLIVKDFNLEIGDSEYSYTDNDLDNNHQQDFFDLEIGDLGYSYTDDNFDSDHWQDFFNLEIGNLLCDNNTCFSA